MDLGLIFILFSFVFSVFYLGFLLKPRRDETQSPKTPPGRFGLPFIGETLDFASNRMKGAPEKFVLDRIKKYSSNVFKTSLFGEQFTVLCGPEGNKLIFSNENKLVKSWVTVTVHKLFHFSDNIHSKETSLKNRKLFHPYLTPVCLDKYVPIMDLVTRQHLHSYWEGRDVVSFYPLSNILTSNLSLRLFLGVEDVDLAKRLQHLFALLTKGVVSVPFNFPGTHFYHALKAKQKLKKEFDTYLKKWKSGQISDSESQSIVADILKQSPDEDDIFGGLLAFMAPATDTVSSTLACVIIALAKYPSVFNNVLAEQREITKSKASGEMLNWSDIQKMKYSWNVVCETLRLYVKCGTTFREVISDFEYDGFFVPKNRKLLIDSCATHNNPEYFTNPEKFDPTRFEGDGPIPFTFIPFGGGPSMCPGRQYAKILILAFMHNLVIKYRWEQILHDEKMTFDTVPVPSKGLPIRLYAHK